MPLTNGLPKPYGAPSGSQHGCVPCWKAGQAARDAVVVSELVLRLLP